MCKVWKCRFSGGPNSSIFGVFGTPRFFGFFGFFGPCENGGFMGFLWIFMIFLWIFMIFYDFFMIFYFFLDEWNFFWKFFSIECLKSVKVRVDDWSIWIDVEFLYIYMNIYRSERMCILCDPPRIVIFVWYMCDFMCFCVFSVWILCIFVYFVWYCVVLCVNVCNCV